MGQVIRPFAILAVLLAAAAPCIAQNEGQPPMEYQVRAAFLLNFTKFIEWHRVQSVEARICIMGEDPFGTLLDQMAEGEVLDGRKLVIQRIHEVAAKSCDVVYFAKRDGKETAAVLSDIGPGILTVGEGGQFLRDGGVIAFVIENRRVRFDISQTGAARARLKISSRLMSVARSVAK
jgi:hypothetical protein